MTKQPSDWTVEATDQSINVIHEASGRHFMFWRIDETPFINMNLALDFVANDRKD